MSGDNFHFDLTGAPLDKSLEIAFIGAPGKKAVGWQVQDGSPAKGGPGGVWGSNKATQRLILFWSIDDAMTAFPAPMTSETVLPMVKAWLESTDYGQQPDQDGDNGKGWRVYNETWGHVDGNWKAFVAIEPVWIMYGK